MVVQASGPAGQVVSVMTIFNTHDPTSDLPTIRSVQLSRGLNVLLTASAEMPPGLPSVVASGPD